MSRTIKGNPGPGKDYWSKVDKIFGPGYGRMMSISHKAKTNRLTKRYTHKSIRQKVRAWINSI
jgi:hypothetical protein